MFSFTRNAQSHRRPSATIELACTSDFSKYTSALAAAEAAEVGALGLSDSDVDASAQAPTTEVDATGVKDKAKIRIRLFTLRWSPVVVRSLCAGKPISGSWFGTGRRARQLGGLFARPPRNSASEESAELAHAGSSLKRFTKPRSMRSFQRQAQRPSAATKPHETIARCSPVASRLSERA